LAFFDVFQRVYRTGKPERHPATFYKDEKISGWRENYIYKLPSGDIVTVFEDTTERKRAEETLRMSEERLRLLSEAAFEAIVIHEEGVLLHANEQYFTMFGYRPGEALGKEMMSLTIAPESLEFAKKQAALDSQEPYELIGLRKDGTRFPIEARARKMEYKGRIVRFGAIRDISDRKKAEAEDQIRASLLEKETMLKEIHHRVKNNLQVISSLLNLQSSHLQEEKAVFVRLEEWRSAVADAKGVLAGITTMVDETKTMVEETKPFAERQNQSAKR
jgi:PAS domain S-box-containing protein